MLSRDRGASDSECTQVHPMTERDFVTTISYFMIAVVSLLIITVILLALILWAVW